eukprot:gene13732-biopygen15658
MRSQRNIFNGQGGQKVAIGQQQHISATQVLWQAGCRPCLRRTHGSKVASVATFGKSSSSCKRRGSIACWAVQGAFEPQIDAAALSAQLLVLAVTGGAAAYWWFAVVPSARRSLAKEKRLGPLNSYLLELQSSTADERRLERWFYTEWLQQLQRRQLSAAQAAAKRQEPTAINPAAHDVDQSTTDEKQSTASFGVPLQQQQQQQSHNKRQAWSENDDGDDDGDKQPSFWSLDNPLLATTALLAIAVAAGLATHSQ